MKQLIDFFKAIKKGDDETFTFSITLSWWEVAAIVTIIGLVIYIFLN